MDYNIFRPWLSLDPWQIKYIETPPDVDCFLLTGRQVGKTTAMSIKAVELCVKHFKRGENVLICSITEKQAYHMLAKALAYAEERYPKKIAYGKDKPTKHQLMFKNGTGIKCYAAGETGMGLRGFTIKKLLIDEGSRMSDEFFVAVTPMLSVAKGSMDIASTPCGKTRYFYECNQDKHFKKFYVSAEDCPRHTQEFLDREKKHMTKLQYAQEYLAQFLDELKRFFLDELIKTCCTLRRVSIPSFPSGAYYLGVDVAGLGKDETTYEILQKKERSIEQIDSIVEKNNLTTETSNKIIDLNSTYKFKGIGVDDGGVGFGVFSELMDYSTTAWKTIALNNASREIDKDGQKSKKLLKEEMYFNLKMLMEQNKLKLLEDDELIASLRSIQFELEIKEGKPTKNRIFGSNSHIIEGLIRAAWLASQDKHLNIWVASSKYI